VNYFNNKAYDTQFKAYLNEIISKNVESFSVIRACKTKDELIEIENYCETKRNDRIIERVKLFKLLTNKPKNAKCLLRYEKYIDPVNPSLIDYRTWIIDIGKNDIFNYLYAIQPKI
jgi:hypothetical protein